MNGAIWTESALFGGVKRRGQCTGSLIVRVGSRLFAYLVYGGFIGQKLAQLFAINAVGIGTEGRADWRDIIFVFGHGRLCNRELLASEPN